MNILLNNSDKSMDVLLNNSDKSMDVLSNDLYYFIFDEFICKNNKDLAYLFSCLFVSKKFNKYAKKTKLYNLWKDRHCMFSPKPGKTLLKRKQDKLFSWLYDKNLCEYNYDEIIFSAKRGDLISELNINYNDRFERLKAMKITLKQGYLEYIEKTLSTLNNNNLLDNYNLYPLSYLYKYAYIKNCLYVMDLMKKYAPDAVILAETYISTEESLTRLVKAREEPEKDIANIVNENQEQKKDIPNIITSDEKSDENIADQIQYAISNSRNDILEHIIKTKSDIKIREAVAILEHPTYTRKYDIYWSQGMSDCFIVDAINFLIKYGRKHIRKTILPHHGIPSKALLIQLLNLREIKKSDLTCRSYNICQKSVNEILNGYEVSKCLYQYEKLLHNDVFVCRYNDTKNIKGNLFPISESYYTLILQEKNNKIYKFIGYLRKNFERSSYINLYWNTENNNLYYKYCGSNKDNIQAYKLEIIIKKLFSPIKLVINNNYSNIYQKYY